MRVRVQERCAILDKAFPVGDRILVVNPRVSFESHVPNTPVVHVSLDKKKKTHEMFISGTLRIKTGSQFCQEAQLMVKYGLPDKLLVTDCLQTLCISTTTASTAEGRFLQCSPYTCTRSH